MNTEKPPIPEGYSENPENKRKEKMVSNQEFKVTYKETITELPPHRKVEMGIKQIRRKEIIDILGGKTINEIYEIFKGRSNVRYDERQRMRIELEKILHFLTEGTFPSYRTWNHAMFADTGDYGRRGLSQFQDEGMYFQRMIPKQRLQKGVDTFGNPQSSFFIKDINGKLKIDDQFPQYREDALMCYNLSVSTGNDIWNETSGPIFIFGNKNKAFVSYIESIISHPEVIQMMKLRNWNMDRVIDFTKVKAPKESSRWGNKDKTMFKPKINYLSYPPKAVDESGIITLVSPDWPDELTRQVEDIYEKNEQLYQEFRMSKGVLEKLIHGTPVEFGKYHPLLPIIQHPDIKPLRWCHADVGIITTQRNMNILFFET